MLIFAKSNKQIINYMIINLFQLSKKVQTPYSNLYNRLRVAIVGAEVLTDAEIKDIIKTVDEEVDEFKIKLNKLNPKTND